MRGCPSVRAVRVLGRAAEALALCAGFLIVGSGVLEVGGTTAGATVAVTASITATSSPAVPSTGRDVPAGSLTIEFSSAGALTTGETLVLHAKASTGTGYVDWDGYSVSAFGMSVKELGASGSDLDIELGAKSANSPATVQVSEVKYSTTDAAGDVVVTARLSGVTFTPDSAVDGTVVQTPPNAPTLTLTARSKPQLDTGASAGVAGTWTLALSGDSAEGSGWVAGSDLTVTVSPPSGTNCDGNDYLYFVGTPTVDVASSSGTSANPSVSASVTNDGACASTQPNELKLSFANAVYFDGTSTGTVEITVGDVRYAVGTTASAIGTGDVGVAASFSESPSTVDVADASNATIVVTPGHSGTPPSGSGTPPGETSTPPIESGTPPSGSGTSLAVQADTPPVTVLQDASDAAISPVHVVGSAKTHVPVGYVCLTLSGSYFDTSASATVTAAAGNGSVGAAVTYQSDAGTGATTATFQVTKASTTQDEYTLTGLAVDAETKTGPVPVTATYGASPTCTQDSVVIGSVTAFTVASTPATRIYGATPDATAAAELEHQFDAVGTHCPGRPGARPVVLATDARYPDALASAYLESSLGTGELLTPTRSLSAATASAIRVEGVTQVYIVGGPLAVSTAVSQKLEDTLAYDCGGTTPLTSDGPVHIEVTRIWGATEYETAQWVAEYPPSSDVGSLDVSGAYAGANSTGGTGKYNDTSGNESVAPATSSTLPTAIVATGRTFQDAESASVLSYVERLPILLTTSSSLSPQVSSAISNLAIKQVVVVGGPLAVSDKVVSSLESLGVSVLRIAGHDASDTSVQLADFEMASRAGHLGAGWDGSGGVTVARGDYFTDGLAGAVVAAGAGRTHTHAPEPLLLCADPTTVGQYLSGFLDEAGRSGIDGDAADRVVSLTVLGGPQAVSPSVVTAMIGDL